MKAWFDIVLKFTRYRIGNCNNLGENFDRKLRVKLQTYQQNYNNFVSVFLACFLFVGSDSFEGSKITNGGCMVID